MGRWLRDNDKAVLIGSQCYSACPYLVAGGTLRALSKNSTVGVHQFYCKLCPPAEQQMQYTQNVMASLLEYLKQMDVSSDLLIATKNVPRDRIKVLQGATLRKWNSIDTTTESFLWKIHGEDNIVRVGPSDSLYSVDPLEQIIRQFGADKSSTPQKPSAFVAQPYEIQVGVYMTAADASRQLANIRLRAPDILAGAHPLTVPVNRGSRQMYRARFAGFDSATAKQTCSAMQKRAIKCLVYRAQ